MSNSSNPNSPENTKIDTLNTLKLETPKWAKEMAEIYKSGSVSQFIIYGNVDDWVTYKPTNTSTLQLFSLRDYLTKILFDPFEVIIAYNRGSGIKVLKGGDLFQNFIKVFDDFYRTNFSKAFDLLDKEPLTLLDYGNLLPKEPKRALAIIDRFIKNGLYRTKQLPDGKRVPDPVKTAVILDYAQYLVPKAEPAYTSPEIIETIIKITDWASDPNINSAFIVTCLIAENLTDLNKDIVENPRSAKIRIDLPNRSEVLEFIEAITSHIQDFSSICDVSREVLSSKLEGLSRIDIQNLVNRSLKNNKRITMEYIRSVKKELIEKSAGGKIEFVESTKTLDDVAGHKEVKEWLRQDAQLIKKGKTKALPMGYLITGRIGTGKTHLVECFAGEAGIPCVELKNFRDKWVGATEGNLETIFKILRAMGQVIVFIDEADQVAGKRDAGEGDSGLSGRIYAMLAREMSDTKNRGKIFWVFATSRPDLLEVDLKRVGRLDVHIPLFPPQTQEDKKELFLSLAKKYNIQISYDDIPDFPSNVEIGGNEMEGILILANRMYELQDETQNKQSMKELLQEAFASYRPMAHAERLEYMDLIAVLECTDKRFLPQKYANIDLDYVRKRIDELKTILKEN